jgi:hypothetical protein
MIQEKTIQGKRQGEVHFRKIEMVMTEVPVKESDVEGKRKGGASLVISSVLLSVKSRKAVRLS